MQLDVNALDVNYLVLLERRVSKELTSRRNSLGAKSPSLCAGNSALIAWSFRVLVLPSPLELSYVLVERSREERDSGLRSSRRRGCT